MKLTEKQSRELLRRTGNRRQVELNRMSLEDYFAQVDTPSAESPVGVRMRRLLKKNPTMLIEAARMEAGGSSVVNEARRRLGWTSAEESAFAQIMQAGHLDRMRAVRLYRRCGEDLTRGLEIARAEAPTEAESISRKASGERLRLRALQTRHSPILPPGTVEIERRGHSELSLPEKLSTSEAV